MEKKRVEISDELKFKLQEMKGILGGIPDDNSFEVAAAGCGGYCMVTCSYYCESQCRESCMSNRWNAQCRLKPDY